MHYIIREIGKLCILIMLWGFPLLLSRWNGDNDFLWFFILSFVVTVGVLNHYEILEQIDMEGDTDETDE